MIQPKFCRLCKYLYVLYEDEPCQSCKHGEHKGRMENFEKDPRLEAISVNALSNVPIPNRMATY